MSSASRGGCRVLASGGLLALGLLVACATASRPSAVDGGADACLPRELCNLVDDDCDGVVDGPAADLACAVPHATGPCLGGRCTLGTCDPGWLECDGTLENGCETDGTSRESCGACGVRCAVTEACEAGGCVRDPAVAVDSAAGWGSHTCAALQSGRVLCWGRNHYGQLGDGTQNDSTVPVEVLGVSGAVIVTAGYAFTCALTDAEVVYCWGVNSFGQLGRGFVTHVDLTAEAPGPVPLDGVRSVSAGAHHACALTADARGWCWGWNTSGQVGDGTNVRSRPSPRPVLGMDDALVLRAGRSHTCATRTDGTVWCWGANDYRTLSSYVPFPERLSPVHLNRARAATMVACATHSCYLSAAGQVECWGANTTGQLGNGSATVALPLQAAVAAPVATVVEAGGSHGMALGGHSCLLALDRSLWCWGNNRSGELGLGTNDPAMFEPAQVPGMDQVSSLSTGSSVTCVVRAGGQLWCWGKNDYGQVGDGTTVDRGVPVPVLGLN